MTIVQSTHPFSRAEPPFVANPGGDPRSNRIYRPLNKMQWVSGVARIFIRIQGQLVQLDLKPKGAERHLIPRDIASSVDRTTVQTSTGVFDCYLLAVGPLVAAKIKSHYNRMTDDDYFDLLFVCQSLELAPLVRQYSAKFREDWKDCFLERVIETDPMDETQVRWALGMDRTPSPPGRHDRSVSDESDTVSALTQCLDQFHPQDYNKPYYVITYFSHNGNICFTDVGGMYKEDEVSSWTGSSILYQGETVPCFMYVDPPTARQYYTWTLGGGQR